MNDTTKTCTKCGQAFPATTEYFARSSSKKDGLQCWCKACKAAHFQKNKERILQKQREYYLENHDEILEKQREYNRVNKEARSKARRAYYEANKETMNENSRIYTIKNREKTAKYQREYRIEYAKKNPDFNRVKLSRRRARIRKLPHTFTAQQWLACLEYFNYCCAVCGNQLRDLFNTIEPHADHWIPINSEQCPGTTPDNMICLCSDCNHRKHAKDPDVWLKEQYGTRKANIILQRIQAYFTWAIEQTDIM